MTLQKGKKLFFFLGLFTLILFAVFSSSHKQKEMKVSAETMSTGQTQLFINQIAGTASQIAQANDLYASVMIAQAVLESNSGQSGLSAAPNNNFFGIKGAYNGASVTMKTWEDDGNGNAYEIDQAFRSYPSIADSLSDYAALLSTPTYAGVRQSNTLSYQDATAALTGLYATDTSYNVKLNSIIQAYGLTAYDVVTPEAPANGVTDPNVAYSQTTSAASTQTAPTHTTVSSTNPSTTVEQVWNSFRSQYTSADTLAQDQAWSDYKNNQ